MIRLGGVARAAPRAGRSPTAALLRVAVRAGAALATAGAVHAAVNARLLRRPRPRPVAPTGPVSVLLPVRDEADRVAACLAALLAQRPPPAEILVLDDGSTDGTAKVVRRVASAAAGRPGAPRLTLHRSRPLPPGWLGKPHACAQLAGLADPASTVLVFVDADVLLAPHAVAAAVELLDRSGLDLVSPYPRQLAGTLAERLVQPLLQWSILTFVPLRLAERTNRPSLAAANGQFLVVRRAAYDRAGGHAAVRTALLDDLALLRAVLRAGGHGTVVDGTHLAHCRMYRGGRELADGYAKSLWCAFGSPAGAAAVLGVLMLGYLLPPLAACVGSRAGLAGYAAGVAGRAVTARRTGARVWPDAAVHPASIALLAWLTARSMLLRHRGRLSWKGRPL